MKLRFTKIKKPVRARGGGSCEALLGKHRIGFIHKRRGKWVFEWSGEGLSFPFLRARKDLKLPLVLEADKLNDLKADVRGALTDAKAKKLGAAIEQMLKDREEQPVVTEDERRSMEGFMDAMNGILRGKRN